MSWKRGNGGGGKRGERLCSIEISTGMSRDEDLSSVEMERGLFHDTHFRRFNSRHDLQFKLRACTSRDLKGTTSIYNNFIRKLRICRVSEIAFN